MRYWDRSSSFMYICNSVTIFRLASIIFTGGIGEKSFIKRRKIADHLRPLGVVLDNDANNSNGSNSNGLISTSDSFIEIRVMKTNEELMIASQVSNLFQ